MSPRETDSTQIRAKIAQHLTLESNDGEVAMSFDLSALQASPEQQGILLKLFRQNPVAVVATEEHRRDLERGEEGPGSQYLTREEFDSIRELGVRLGTAGVIAETACDFCLHCVKLEALPNWNAGIGT